MMNAARLAVGMQGVAVAERATQRAHRLCQGAPAGPRRQRARPASMAPIIEHADIRRSLHDHEGADAGRARHLPRHGASETDVARRAKNAGRAGGRRRSAWRCSRRSPRPSPPTSAARWPPSACRCTAAWASSRRPARRSIYRDARILPIYEGTNGIQAIDLVTRKLPLEGGKVVEGYIAELTQTADEVRASNRPEFGRMGERLGEAVAALAEATPLDGRRAAPRTRRRRWPAPRPTCGCSAWPPAASISPRARWPRRATARQRPGQPIAARPLLRREPRHRRAGPEGDDRRRRRLHAGPARRLRRDRSPSP